VQGGEAGWVMHWVRRIWHKAQTEKRLDSELQFHLEQQVADYVAAGTTPEEARRRANLEFGGVERFKEECRDARPETHVHAFLYDLRYAWRGLRKDLRFSLLVVFALMLGIGCSSIIFSIVYNGVLHPFPYRDSDRLVALSVIDPGEPDRKGRTMFTLEEIRAFREQSHTFEDVAGWSNWWVLYSNGKGTERLHGARVTPNAFELLGVQPILGRSLAPEDAKAGAPPVVAIDYRLWRKTFHSDPGVIGREIFLDQKPVTIVAVMPKRFTTDGADLWSPVPAESEKLDPHKPDFGKEPTYFFASGILRRGVSQTEAAADLDVIAKQFAAQYPQDYPKQFAMKAQSLSDAVIAEFKAVVDFLCAAVGMLLLISSSNVANLLLTRATAREREIALRASIGASRGRLMRQLLTESLLLAAGGCLAGALFAYSGLLLMIRYMPPRVPGEADMSMNLPVLTFAIVVSLVTVLLCGLSPALHAVSGNYRGKLIGMGSVATSLRQTRLRSALVIAEIALAMVLLVCAGLTVRSFRALSRLPVGFDPSHVTTASLTPPMGRYTTVPAKKQFFDEVLRRVSAVPGVVAAATTVTVPTESGWGSILTIPGKTPPPTEAHPTHEPLWGTGLDLCSEDLFRVLDVRLLKGRLLTATDIAEARRVAVVNEAFVRKFFEGEDPIGQRFKLNDFDRIPDTPRDAYFEIIGVISDVQNRGMDGPPQEVYLPYTFTGFGYRWLLVRTSVKPETVLNEIREQIWSVDPTVAISDAESMNSVLARAYLAGPQFAMFAISAFASVGLLLVIIGVFGLMAYTVSLQRHEIGLRMALGALPISILGMVLAKGARLLVAGLSIGLAAALVVSYLLRAQFFRLSPADPLTYSVGCGILVVVGLLASWFPAMRATRVDPTTALRYE
jgi:predicted permease